MVFLVYNEAPNGSSELERDWLIAPVARLRLCSVPEGSITVRKEVKKDEHKENCYITLFFNNGTLWCNHKTFTKYSHGDAVSQRHIYISSIIYLQIKKFILRAWFKCCCLESNLLLVTSYNTSILTSFTYRRICKLTRFMYKIYRNEPRH